MTSALSIANQGHEVHLVEKEKDLGGIARKIHHHPGRARCPGLPAGSHQEGIPAPLDTRLYRCGHHECHGYIGNFVTKVKSDRGITEIKHGAAVIAIGADVYTPTEYLYGQDDRVMTHLELEEKIAEGDEKVRQRPEPRDDPVRRLQK